MTNPSARVDSLDITLAWTSDTERATLIVSGLAADNGTYVPEANSNNTVIISAAGALTTGSSIALVE